MNSHAATPASTTLPQRVRHTLRFRALQVITTERIGTHFIRVILGGHDLEGFYSPGFDDHVKLIFPDPVTGQLASPQLGPNGPVWPDQARPLMRDYTPRHYDPVQGQLSIDFALHEAGPATTWAAQAKAGDSLGVGGPRGSLLVSTEFSWHLLIGDETALPAIARRLEELPADTRAIVLLEVDSASDELALTSAAALDLTWCHRAGAKAGTSAVLLDTLRGLSWPQGEGYAWVACETHIARSLRTHLLEVRQMPASLVKAAGYWRSGSENSHERIDE